ncbi:MAG: MFS transporter [Pseudomonadota bacterium]
MAITASDNTSTLRAAAKRNVVLLALTTSILGPVAPISIATGGLAGQTLLGNDHMLATLPVTGFNLGVGLGAIPAALLMRRIGRKRGFMAGAGVAFLGGLVSALALIYAYFWLFALGVSVVGASYSFVAQYRFAAADYGDEDFKAKAISFVMLGGIGSAIIGPQLVIFTSEALAPYTFAGSYLAICGIAIVGMLMLAFLQPVSSPEPGGEVETPQGRPMAQIVRQPRFIVATIVTISGGSLMSFVMTAAPLAMIACGFSVASAAMGIQWHVIAMFAPSFFTGHLMTRFGKERVVAAGLLILVVCAIVALSGIQLWQFWLALILLGVGWNFAFISGTALVTTTYRHEERQRVQGVFDFLVYGFAAVASGLSGVVLNLVGWNVVNLIIFPVVALALGCLIWLARQPQEPVAA